MSVVVDYNFDGDYITGTIYSGYIEEHKDGSRTVWFTFATSADKVKEREHAKVLSDFSFWWRNVWDWQISFERDKFSYKELLDMSEIWNQLRTKFKDIIKTAYPDNLYDNYTTL